MAAHELDRLEATLGSAIASQGSAELAIIYLFEHYDFDLDALMAGVCNSDLCSGMPTSDILSSQGSESFFFQDKIQLLAPFVGLDPLNQLTGCRKFCSIPG